MIVNGFKERLTNDFSKIMPECFMIKYIDHLNGVIITDHKGVPISGWEHKELIELLTNTINNYGDKFNNDMERLKDERINELLNPHKEEFIIDKPIKKSPGYVYFVKCNDVVKIGRTKNLKERMEVYSVKSPFETEILHQVETDNCVRLERHFHAIFMDKRTDGEWFRLTKQDIADIKSDKYLKESTIKKKKAI